MRELSTAAAWEVVPIFLRMVGDFSAGKVGDYEDCSDNLDQLLHLAQIHSLVPVIYYMLGNQRSRLTKRRPELVEYMQKVYYTAIHQSLTQEESVREMREAFSQHGIQLVYFKGVLLRELYPVPELRTMSDMDCLIEPKDRIRAHKLMEQLGYRCELNDEPVWVYRRETVMIEMHTELAGNGVGNGFDCRSFFSDAMKHVMSCGGQLFLEREYHFCYLIYHIAKHLSSTGAGVRMIADIAAFLHDQSTQMDWKRVEDMLRGSNLWEVALAIYGLCHRWFGMGQPMKYCGSEQLLDELEAYIVAGGTFGFETHDTGDVYRRRALRTKPSTKYAISLSLAYLFPPKSYLVRYFPLSERYGWLLPVAWFRRCWLGVFHRKAHSLATMRSVVKGDANRSYRELLMLRELGL